MTESVPQKQHFTFEMYAPTSCTESGTPIVERVQIQMQGADLTLYEVIAKFEDFLKAAGYTFDGKCLDLVEKRGIDEP
jgi:hypothetical protein